MRCADCKRELEVGDRYIKDTASGYMKEEGSPEIDSLVAMVMGGDEASGEIYYCEDCTVSGGDYLFETVYGDEEGFGG